MSAYLALFGLHQLPFPLMLPSPGSSASPLTLVTVTQARGLHTKCRLRRWSGEQKPPGDSLGLEEHLRQQKSLLTGDRDFTWSVAQSRGGERPHCWMKYKRSDRWSGKYSRHGERFRINLFSTAEEEHTCLAHLGAVLHHSWVACSPFSSESYLFGPRWIYAFCLCTSVDRQEEILGDT